MPMYPVRVTLSEFREGLWYEKNRQESLADAKAIARQQAPSEEIYSESTIRDFLLMVNTNRSRITYGLRDIFGCRG